MLTVIKTKNHSKGKSGFLLLEISIKSFSAFIFFKTSDRNFRETFLENIAKTVKKIIMKSRYTLLFSQYKIPSLLFQGLIKESYIKSGSFESLRISPSSEKTIEAKSVMPGLISRSFFSESV